MNAGGGILLHIAFSSTDAFDVRLHPHLQLVVVEADVVDGPLEGLLVIVARDDHGVRPLVSGFDGNPASAAHGVANHLPVLQACIDGREEEWMDGWIDEQMGGCLDGEMGRWMAREMGR